MERDRDWLVVNVLIVLLILLVLILFLVSEASGKYVRRVDESLVERSREYVMKEMNQKENGMNRGFCEKYQEVLGLPKGSPYCYAGQFWCYERASKDLNIHNPLPRSGLAISVYYWAKGNKVNEGARIDDFVVWRNMGTSFGHIERVKKVLRAGWVETFAFNVGDGSRVVRRNYRYPLGRKVFLGLVGVR